MEGKLDLLCNQINSGEVRDVEKPDDFVNSQLAPLLMEVWTNKKDKLVRRLHESFSKLVSYPEFKSVLFHDVNVGIRAIARVEIAQNANEMDALSRIVLMTYGASAGNQKILGGILGNLLSAPVSSSPQGNSLAFSLRVIKTIFVTASGKVSKEISEALLLSKLLPLHEIEGMASPTVSLLQAFHQDLTSCCLEVAQRAGLINELLIGLVSRYPSVHEANSPKEVLFLHEMEYFLKESSSSPSLLKLDTIQKICTLLERDVGSLNSMISERALSFWKNGTVVAKLNEKNFLLNQTCEKTIVKTMETHWSQTVRNMCGAALIAMNPSTTTIKKDDSIVKAVEVARTNLEQLKIRQETLQKEMESIQPPKTFTSLSVIRDDLQPFSVGAFGVLWKGRSIVPGSPKALWPVIALKEMENKEMARKEIQVLNALQAGGGKEETDCANLVKMLGVFESKFTISIVLEFIEGQDLHSVIVSNGSLSLQASKFLAGEIGRKKKKKKKTGVNQQNSGNALNYIHAKNYIYGDMKPENILIHSKTGRVKVCDFGSCVSKSETSKKGGTVEYMPPEQTLSVEADWWAFGCVIHFMIAGRLAGVWGRNEEGKRLTKKMWKRPPVYFDEKESDGKKDGVAFKKAVTFAESGGGGLIADKEAKDLINALCNKNPANRPKDGGESFGFFSPARPWRDLIKKQPVKIEMGTVKKSDGPWSRRTFSMITSPLPSEYLKDVEKMEKIKMDIAVSFLDTSSEKAFVAHCQVIPKERDKEEEAVQREKEDARAKNYGGSANRSNNYNVAGLNLSAG